MTARRKDTVRDYFSAVPPPEAPAPVIQQHPVTGSTTPTRDDLGLDGGQPSAPGLWPATTPPAQTTSSKRKDKR